MVEYDILEQRTKLLHKERKGSGVDIISCYLAPYLAIPSNIAMSATLVAARDLREPDSCPGELQMKH